METKNVEVLSSLSTLEAFGLGLGLHRRRARHWIMPLDALEDEVVDKAASTHSDRDLPPWPLLRVELGEAGVVADIGDAYAWVLAGHLEDETAIDELVSTAIAAGRVLQADPKALAAHRAVIRSEIEILRIEWRAFRRAISKRAHLRRIK